VGLPDRFDKLYDDLSVQLPNKQDKELLKTLLGALREGGKEMVMEKMDEIIDDLVEEDR
jgi:hypothetical protein